MRDVAATDYSRLAEAQRALAAHLGDRGYIPIDTPLLEDAELFVRKSGGELTSRLYTFTDPGGQRVSLRPEFTSSVIRHYVQKGQGIDGPVRWQYGGPVFRYEPQSNGAYRQFTQVGAELVGAAGVAADTELVSLAWDGLEVLGLTGHQLRIGHLGVLHGLLSTYGLSEAAKLFMIANVQALKSGALDVTALKARAEDVGLLKHQIDQGNGVGEGLVQEAAQDFIQGLLKESMPAPVGRRTAQQIVDRLLRKARDRDDAGAFEDAAALIARLSRLDGPPPVALSEAREAALDRRRSRALFDDVEELCEGLARCRIAESRVTLDFGLARGISYYTGAIFELVSVGETGRTSLGGGGRYDGLVKALGGDEDVPALGFAYYLDQIVELLGEAGESEASSDL